MHRHRTIVIIAAAILAWALPPAAHALEHFTCYGTRRAPGEPRFQKVEGVSLVDRIRASTVTVRRPSMLCLPTDKNGEDPDAPAKPDHLEEYKSKAEGKFTKVLGQEVTDQFGTLTLDLRKPQALQVPTLKDQTSTPPAPPVPSVDHFQCYKVRTSKGAPKFQQRFGFALVDQFSSMTVDVKRPSRLCLPTDKNGESPGAESHADHLMCYKIRQADRPRFAGTGPLWLNNQFGPEVVNPRRPKELCVPALVAGVGGTPTPTVTATPTPSPTPTLPVCAAARTVTDASDLLAGPLARGQLGDFRLENDRIQVIVQQPGRVFFGIGTYGGNIIDADLQRLGEAARDHFEELIPGINIENTARYTSATVVNDGADCQPAVVRFTGVDDLFDFVNGSSAIRDLGFFFPPGADDRDLPVAVQTDYTLATGDRYVQIDTTITNLDPAPLSIYFIEYINGSGELEMWRPAYGFGEPLATTSCPAANDEACTSAGSCDVCNVIAFSGDEGAAGVSYGYVHTVNRTTAVTVSGVTVPVLGQEVAAVFQGADTPNFTMQPAGLPGDAVTITRYFAVGDGTVASIVDVRNAIQGIPTGTLAGTVTSGGQPVAGADVVVLGAAATAPALLEYNVVTHFRTAADGTYRGTLPAGAYEVRAQQDGRGVASPDPANVAIVVATTTTQDFTLPAPGGLRVTVADENGLPVPAKVQLVGFDPSPDPLNTQDVLGALTNVTGVFGEPAEDGLAFGIAFVTFADRTGDTGLLDVDPGDYQVVVSRGPRYSAFTQAVTIVPGSTTTVAAQIARVVDTPGFIGADFHVHAIDSPDSEVTRVERVATEVAEGMDFFTPSDHDFRADFVPTIAAMGVGDLIAVAPSAEITTFDYGHFNAWPVALVPFALHSGGVDWGRAGPVGMDFPQYGSYVLSPVEIFAAAHADTPGNVVQINHIDSHFGILGLDIDTAEGGTGPPQSHRPPADRRLDPAVANHFDPGFDALEVWIGTDGRGGIDTLVGRNLGHWFNLLNQGIIRTGVTSSDTHQRRTTQINARSWVASLVTDPGQLSGQALTLASHVRDGRVVGSNAPFVTISASAASTGQTASLSVGQSRQLSTVAGQPVDVTVTVASPLWAAFDAIDFYVNNAPQPFDQDGDGNLRNYRVTADVPHTAGTDFTVTTVPDFPAIPGASHYEATTTLTLGGLTADTWVVAVVRGTDGVSPPTFPVLPNSLDEGSNATLADLTDGNLGEGGMPAFAYTNPLFIDADNDGTWTPPGVSLTPP